MQKRPLAPKTIINIEGKLAYAEEFQFWNIFRHQKIIKIFWGVQELKILDI